MICSKCKEVLSPSSDKDYIICPKCGEYHYCSGKNVYNQTNFKKHLYK